MLNSLKYSLCRLQPLVVRETGFKSVIKPIINKQCIQYSSLNKLSCSSSLLKTNNLDSTVKVRYITKYKDPYEQEEFEAPSPFRNPGPRDYGHNTNYMTGGLLPRSDKPKKFLQRHNHKNSWSSKRALFGQNDYIDLLGDGSIHPVQLIKGPKWLVGFNGNEFQRITRKIKCEGEKFKKEEPEEYRRLKKRLWFLFKKYNQKRISKYK